MALQIPNQISLQENRLNRLLIMQLLVRDLNSSPKRLSHLNKRMVRLDRTLMVVISQATSIDTRMTLITYLCIQRLTKWRNYLPPKSQVRIPIMLLSCKRKNKKGLCFTRGRTNLCWPKKWKETSWYKQKMFSSTGTPLKTSIHKETATLAKVIIMIVSV